MKTVSASRRRGQETQSRIFQATMTAILFNRNRYAFCVSLVTYTAVSLTWKLHGCQFELGIAEKKGILSGESAVGLLLLGFWMVPANCSLNWLNWKPIDGAGAVVHSFCFGGSGLPPDLPCRSALVCTLKTNAETLCWFIFILEWEISNWGLMDNHGLCNKGSLV